MIISGEALFIAGSIGAGIAAVFASIHLGEQIRIRQYCAGLNNALSEAVGHYRATVELIVNYGASLESLDHHPVLDPPNVGEFKPIITATRSKRLEHIDVIIEGQKALIDYICGRYAQKTSLCIQDSTTRRAGTDSVTWEARLTLGVFDNLDAVVIENLRSLLSRR
jgi:hypothetical protein